MTQCKENTKEEEDEREQERSATASEAGYMCSLNGRVRLVSRVTSERDGEPDENFTNKFCKLEKRQLILNDNFSVAQRQVRVDEHASNCKCPYQDVQFCKLRGHTSKKTLRKASCSIRTDISRHLKYSLTDTLNKQPILFFIFVCLYYTVVTLYNKVVHMTTKNATV